MARVGKSKPSSNQHHSQNEIKPVERVRDPHSNEGCEQQVSRKSPPFSVGLCDSGGGMKA